MVIASHLLVGLCFLGLADPGEADVTDAYDAVRAVEASLDVLRSSTLSGTVEVEFAGAISESFNPNKQYEFTLVFDQPRVDLTFEAFEVDSAGARLEEEPAFNVREFSDGEHDYQYRDRGSSGSYLSKKSASGSAWEAVGVWLGPCAAVFGFAPGTGGVELMVVLEHASEITTKAASTTAGEIVEATTKYGSIELELDVRRRFPLRSLKLRRGTNHLGANGEKLSTPLEDLPPGAQSHVPYARIVDETYEISFEASPDVAVPRKVIAVRRTVYETKETVIERAVLTMTSVNLNSDFDEAQAFGLSTLPDGLRVVDEDALGIYYQILAGTIVPVIDEPTLESIRHHAEAFRPEAAANDLSTITTSRTRTIARMERRSEGISRDWFTSPYCGIFSIYAATAILRAEPTPFEELVSPRYVGSREGSAVAELVAGAERCGLSALPLRGATTQWLSKIQDPVILHIKSSPLSESFDHYALYVGGTSNSAWLVDGPNDPREVPFGELAARWDGVAVLLSDTLIDRRRVLASLYSRLAIFLVGGLVVLGVIGWIVRRRAVDERMEAVWPGWRATGLQAFGVLVLVGGAGLVINWLSPTGLLKNGIGVEFVKMGHVGAHLDRISFDEARRLHKDGDTIFVDARPLGDFQLGHMTRAINIDPSARFAERRSKFNHLAKNLRIVVYCKGPDCEFADRVASELYFDGFENVMIYPGGWEEWSANQSEDPPR